MIVKIRARSMLMNILEYLLALVLIINCRSIYVTIAEGPNYENTVRIILIFLCMVSLLIKYRFPKKIFEKTFSFAIFFLIYFLLFWLQDSYRSIGYLLQVSVFLSLILYEKICDTINDKTSSILNKYTDIVCVISVISIFFWTMGSYLNIINPTGSLNSNWTGEINVYITVPSYYGVYFETQNINFLGLLRIVRNSACFAEAPMANFHFCLALLIELFHKEKTSIRKVVLLCIAIASTFSTTGYIVFVLALLFKYTSLEGGKAVKIAKIIILPLFIIGIFNGAENLLVSKLSSLSGSTRLDDISAGLKAWNDNIIMGNGFGNDLSYQQYMSSFRGNNVGFSNSILMILAYGGIYLAAPYFYGIVLSIRKSLTSKNINNLFFVIIFIFLMTFTITPFTGIVMYILIFCCDKKLMKESILQNSISSQKN